MQPRTGAGARFVFRRDPRDISTVSFWDPELQRYSMIPYRNTTHPPISIWELRELRGKLHEAGRTHIDEAAIFEAYRRLREREARAVSETQRTRRARARRPHSVSREAAVAAAVTAEPVAPSLAIENITPFEIEEL